MEKEKPVVQYVGEAKVYVWPYSPKDKPIFVADLPLILNHPLLGEERGVRTSQIVKHPDENGRFETRNTIYEKVESAA